MVNNAYEAEHGRDFFRSVSRSLLISEEEASWFGYVSAAGMGPPVSLNGKVNANMY